METNRLNDNFAFEFLLLALEAHAPGNFFCSLELNSVRILIPNKNLKVKFPP